ncbi:hypothetical protein BH11PSE5_BH11PSE5_33400 [soil metagenome]
MFDRRTFLTSASTAVLTMPYFAKASIAGAGAPLASEPDCEIPDFAGLLSGDAKLQTVRCGLRPGRKRDGAYLVRLESESLSGDRTLIHNYGHCGGGVTLGLGCASLADKYLATTLHLPKNAKITIVGAGIVGLSVAYVLKSRKYTDVTIKAHTKSSGSFEKPKTVSDIAGGQFEPAGVDDFDCWKEILDAASATKRLKTVMAETLAVLTEYYGRDVDPFCVDFVGKGDAANHVYVPVRNYTTKTVLPKDEGLDLASQAVHENPVLREWIKSQSGGQLLPDNEPGGVRINFFYGTPPSDITTYTKTMGVRDTILINTANLIKNLLAYLASSQFGPQVRIETHTVGPDELRKLPGTVIFNCAGLGGARVGGDHEQTSMTPVYGLLAEAPRNKTADRRYLYSGFGYMFPRTDGTIVGGVFEERASASDREYLNSLLPTAKADRQRATTMVTAVGYYFTDKLSALKPMDDKIGWMSGKIRNFACASEGKNCQ